ncbi:MAG: hypothetical protein J6565_01700 [Lactobacillus sp.]|nr:hypothetical protein [Lactobacillus sp.]
MVNKIISEQLKTLIDAIIDNLAYPREQELSLSEKKQLVTQLKKINQKCDNFSEKVIITDVFYKDKIAKEFKIIDNNFGWIFEILQHELVSATRLHALLLDLAHEEHFSLEGINKINHYFSETDDHGDNDNFVTMSFTDLIDSLNRAKIFQVETNPSPQKQSVKKSPTSIKRASSNKIIKLYDY